MRFPHCVKCTYGERHGNCADANSTYQEIMRLIPTKDVFKFYITGILRLNDKLINFIRGLK